MSESEKSDTVCYLMPAFLRTMGRKVRRKEKSGGVLILDFFLCLVGHIDTLRMLLIDYDNGE